MENDKQSKIILGVFLLIIAGGLAIYDINKRCVRLPQNECNSLWILFIVAIIGGGLLTETLIKKKIQDGVETSNTSNQDNYTKRSTSQIWGASIVRIILSTFMLSLPILFQGAFVVSVVGMFVGSVLVVLYRRATNQYPL